MSYQPKTGAKCTCRKGIERDNCPQCEGTGMVIDFAAIHRARDDDEDQYDRADYNDEETMRLGNDE